MYDLEPLPQSDLSRWDELITPCANRELFHRDAWLQYLASSRGIKICRWAITDHGRTIGYFPAGVTRKGPFKILGSPLRGWGSGTMGPVVLGDFEPERFLKALDELARRERIATAEIESSVLPDEYMERFGYECTNNATMVVELTPEDPQVMFRRIKSTTRNEIRRAQKNGLVAEDSSDRNISRQLYEGWTEISARRANRPPPYGFRIVDMMVEHLKQRDLMFAMCVRTAEGIPAATGFFPHDDRSVYFSLTGNRKEYFHLYPNDLLQWSLMTLAAARGIRRYDMYGCGHFKSKFGGQLLQKNRYLKYYSESARLARWSYARYFDAQGWVRNQYRKLAGALGRSHDTREQDTQ